MKIVCTNLYHYYVDGKGSFPWNIFEADMYVP